MQNTEYTNIANSCQSNTANRQKVKNSRFTMRSILSMQLHVMFQPYTNEFADG